MENLHFSLKVDIQGLQMADLLSFVFVPISFVMGVEWADCRQVIIGQGGGVR